MTVQKRPPELPGYGPPQEGDWTTGIFDCYKDPSNAAAVAFCWPCSRAGLVHSVDESQGTFSECFWAWGCMCLLALDWRTMCFAGPESRAALRSKFGLPGDICHDLLLYVACPCEMLSGRSLLHRRLVALGRWTRAGKLALALADRVPCCRVCDLPRDA